MAVLLLGKPEYLKMTKQSFITQTATNWIAGKSVPPVAQHYFDKCSPATGQVICQVPSSEAADVSNAVEAASAAFVEWSEKTPVERGEIIRSIAQSLQEHKQALAELVHLETGKSVKDALGETQGAIEQGYFMAGEGRRLYGKTMTSAMPERTSMLLRRPVGVCGLIVAANTPIANIAWKVFPALICGNTAVLKPSEDTPLIADAFFQIAKAAGLPDGVLNIVHGNGQGAGAPIVAHPKVDLVSFTGSTSVGRWVAQHAGERMAKVFLELGGKNPLVVCDDADLDNACHWVLLSAFSNAGQRCSSSSRVIVFDSIYEQFKARLVEKTQALTLGDSDENDLGPVINERQLNNMLEAIQRSTAQGGSVLVGGSRLDDDERKEGYYMAPTLIEGVTSDQEISRAELFGPIACLYRVANLEEAIALSNDSDYGLTACIHTSSVHRAMKYSMDVQAGVANINTGTFGSEPHMPFGGVKQSGNGLREPGAEALDVYCEYKNININYLPDRL